MASEGHDEAALILDFEAAAEELAQTDSELDTSYIEARKKLGERFRNRGFLPLSKGSSKGERTPAVASEVGDPGRVSPQVARPSRSASCRRTAAFAAVIGRPNAPSDPTPPLRISIRSSADLHDGGLQHCRSWIAA